MFVKLSQNVPCKMRDPGLKFGISLLHIDDN